MVDTNKLVDIFGKNGTFWEIPVPEYDPITEAESRLMFVSRLENMGGLENESNLWIILGFKTYQSETFGLGTILSRVRMLC